MLSEKLDVCNSKFDQIKETSENISWTFLYDKMPEQNDSCCKPVMTKLMQWLLGATILFSVWASIVTRQWKTTFTEDWMHVIIPSPLIAVLMFGVYAGVVVLWRVYNFNDCEDAAKELLEQIQEAKQDLKRKGMKLEEVSDK